MLKWTLNNKRTDPIAQFKAVLDSPCMRSRKTLTEEIREHRRKIAFTKRYRNRNKENQVVVASPHPLAMRRRSSTPNRMVPQPQLALRDVGNRTPVRRPSLVTTPLRKRHLPLSPDAADRRTPDPNAVQSPVGVAARRGCTVPDAYLGSARYLGDDAEQPSPAKRQKHAASTQLTPLSRRLAELRFSKISIRRNAMLNSNLDDEEDEMNMSSKSLNNTDLEKMIDEILQSTRKVRPIPKHLMCPMPVGPQVTPNTSTIPAAAVSIVADHLTNTTIIRAAVDQTVILHDDAAICNEREVRSPDGRPANADTRSAGASDECGHLRRQGGVRRKNVRVHREFVCTEQTRQIHDMMNEHPYLRQSIELLANMNTPKSKQYRWV